MVEYYLWNGVKTSRQEIRQAFAAGLARLIHHYSGGNPGLMLNGKDFDYRVDDYCIQMGEITWTSVPDKVTSCYRASEYEVENDE
jgi:hypothetical protein